MDNFEHDAERLLRGSPVPAGSELAPLTEVVAGLKGTFVVRPEPQVRERHLAAIADARAGVVDVPRSRRSRRLRGRALAGVGAAALVLVGGSSLAATGSLPAPAQNVVARAAKAIGVAIPEVTPQPTLAREPSPESQTGNEPQRATPAVHEESCLEDQACHTVESGTEDSPDVSDGSEIDVVESGGTTRREGRKGRARSEPSAAPTPGAEEPGGAAEPTPEPTPTPTHTPTSAPDDPTSSDVSPEP